MCSNKRPFSPLKPKEEKPNRIVPQHVLDGKKILIKCGKCYECKKERARNWVFRIWLEALKHQEKCFVSLTYQKKPDLSIFECQDFLKRLRKNEKIENLKYFCAGEYGEKKRREYYHFILLGWKPKDCKFRGKLSKKGNKIYQSKSLQKLWGKGFITVQNFHYKEIGYLTLYLNKNEKIKGINDKEDLIREIRNDYKQLNENTLETIGKKYDCGEDGKSLKKYLRKLLRDNETIAEEFNLFSKGMGFQTFLEKEYYKYPLIIDGYTFEIPRDFIRRIIENPEKYTTEQVEYCLKIRRETVEIAEKQYDENVIKNKNALQAINDTSEAKNFNKIKLYKKDYTSEL